MGCVEGIFLLSNGFYGKGKNKLFQLSSQKLQNDKIFHQKHEFFTFELRVIKLVRLDKCKAAKNVVTSKRYIFSKRVQKNWIL